MLQILETFVLSLALAFATAENNLKTVTSEKTFTVFGDPVTITSELNVEACSIGIVPIPTPTENSFECSVSTVTLKEPCDVLTVTETIMETCDTQTVTVTDTSDSEPRTKTITSVVTFTKSSQASTSSITLYSNSSFSFTGTSALSRSNSLNMSSSSIPSNISSSSIPSNISSSSIPSNMSSIRAPSSSNISSIKPSSTSVSSNAISSSVSSNSISSSLSSIEASSSSSPTSSTFSSSTITSSSSDTATSSTLVVTSSVPPSPTSNHCSKVPDRFSLRLANTSLADGFANGMAVTFNYYSADEYNTDTIFEGNGLKFIDWQGQPLMFEWLDDGFFYIDDSRVPYLPKENYFVMSGGATLGLIPQRRIQLFKPHLLTPYCDPLSGIWYVNNPNGNNIFYFCYENKYYASLREYPDDKLSCYSFNLMLKEE